LLDSTQCLSPIKTDHQLVSNGLSDSACRNQPIQVKPSVRYAGLKSITQDKVSPINVNVTAEQFWQVRNEVAASEHQAYTLGKAVLVALQNLVKLSIRLQKDRMGNPFVPLHSPQLFGIYVYPKFVRPSLRIVVIADNFTFPRVGQSAVS